MSSNRALINKKLINKSKALFISSIYISNLTNKHELLMLFFEVQSGCFLFIILLKWPKQ